MGRGQRVEDGGPAGLDDDLLDEGADEGPGLGQLAGLEELAHLLCEGGDGVGAVQHRPALRPVHPEEDRVVCPLHDQRLTQVFRSGTAVAGLVFAGARGRKCGLWSGLVWRRSRIEVLASNPRRAGG